MFKLKTGYRLLSNNLPSNLIAVFVVALSMLAVNFCVNYFSGFYTPAKMLKPLEEGYICEINSDEFDAANLAGLKSISYGYSTTGLAGGKQLEIKAYDMPLARLAKVKLEKGAWYMDKENANGEYNAVVTKNSGFKIGDLLTASIAFSSEAVHFRITGILPDSFYLYRLEGLATPPSAESAVSIHPSVGNTYQIPLLLTDCAAIKSHRINHAAYLRFEDKLTPEQLSHNQEYMRMYGNCASIAELEKNSITQAREASQLFIPMAALLALLSVIGTTAVVGITITQNKKTIALLFYCGAKQSDVTEIIGLYITTVFAFSATIYSVANGIINNYFENSGAYMSNRASFWCTLLIAYAVIAGVAMLLGNKLKNNISATIKEE